MPKVKEFKTNLILPEDEDFEGQVIEKLLPIKEKRLRLPPPKNTELFTK